jgi:hypothetical protein
MPPAAPLRRLPWAEARSLLAEARDAGFTRDEAIDLATGVLDAAFDAEALVPGPAGKALERADGPLIRAALALLWTSVAARLPAAA